MPDILNPGGQQLPMREWQLMLLLCMVYSEHPTRLNIVTSLAGK
jgi:hypothetical protein